MKAKELNKLLCEIQSGDNRSFERLYLETKRGVYAFLYTYLNHHEDTEDAMQTVYLKIKQNIDKYRPRTNARAWILQIAKNHALNELKKSDRITYTDNIDCVADEVHIETEGLADLMKRVLTEDEQQVVTLHVLWNYRHREIGEILGCPTGTVTSKYKRAVEKLKKSLKGVKG